MGNFGRVFIAVILIISLFTVSVFATPTGTYDLYGTNGRNIYGYTGSGNDYITNFSSHLAHLQVYLDQILSYNANISSTIDYYLPALLTRMIDNFSPGAGDTRTMWQLSAAAVSGITAIQSAALGIAQDVYNISTYVDGIEGKLDTLHSDNTSSNSKLDTLHSDLTTINTNIDEVETKLGTTNTLLYNTNSSLTSISSNTDQLEGYVDGVESSLGSINSNILYLESISWNLFNQNLFSYSTNGIDYYSDFSNFSNSKTLYIKYRYSILNYSLCRFDIDIRTLYFYDLGDLSIKFYQLNNTVYPEYYYESSYSRIKLFVYPFSSQYNYDTIIELKFNDSNYFSFNNNSNVNMYYLNYDSIDFYTVDNFIQSHKKAEDNTLSDIKNILIDIDNNSDFIQNNNDLQINVDIDAADGNAITNIVSKLKSLFNTGVSLQQFLVGLNEFDNLNWFTSVRDYNQVNYNPSNNLGYQNIYD